MNDLTQQGNQLPATQGDLKPLTSMVDVGQVQRNIRPTSIFLAQSNSKFAKDGSVPQGSIFSSNPNIRILNDGKTPFYFIPLIWTLSIVTRLYAGNKLNDNLGALTSDKILNNPLVGNINSPKYNEHYLKEDKRKGYVDPSMDPKNPFAGYTYEHERKINFFVVPYVKNLQGQDVFELPPFQWPLEKMAAVTLGESLMSILLRHCVENPQGNFPFDYVFSVNVKQQASKQNANLTYFTYGDVKQVQTVQSFQPKLLPELQNYYKGLCDLISASQIDEDVSDEPEAISQPAPAPVQPMAPQPAQTVIPQPTQTASQQPPAFSQPIAPQQPPAFSQPAFNQPAAPVQQPPAFSQPAVPQPAPAPAPTKNVQQLSGASPHELNVKAQENFNKVPNNKEVSQTISYTNQQVIPESDAELNAMMDKI